MDYKEDELVRIYNLAILPDTVDPVGKPQNIPTYPVIAEQELGHYCSGLEQNLVYLQRKYNILKKKTADYNRERENLLREIKDLRWKVEHERGNLVNEIEALRWPRLAFSSNWKSLIIASFKSSPTVFLVELS